VNVTKVVASACVGTPGFHFVIRTAVLLLSTRRANVARFRRTCTYLRCIYRFDSIISRLNRFFVFCQLRRAPRGPSFILVFVLWPDGPVQLDGLYAPNARPSSHVRTSFFNNGRFYEQRRRFCGHQKRPSRSPFSAFDFRIFTRSERVLVHTESNDETNARYRRARSFWSKHVPNGGERYGVTQLIVLPDILPLTCRHHCTFCTACCAIIILSLHYRIQNINHVHFILLLILFFFKPIFRPRSACLFINIFMYS